MSYTRSHSDNYSILMNQLTDLGVIQTEKRDLGKYIHKSKINHPYSLLIVSNAEFKYTLYELIHSGPENKKKILGTGKKTTVRAAVNVETGDEVAVKVYALYPKASAPSAYSLLSFRSGAMTNCWQLVQAINKKLPASVVTLKDYIVGGDKTNADNPGHLVCYAVTNKLNQSLHDFIYDKANSIETIQQIFVKLFKNVRSLYQHEVTWADGSFRHVLLDDNLNPVICNPESSLAAHGISDQRIGLFIGLGFELLMFIHHRFDLTPGGNSGYLKAFNAELNIYLETKDNFRIPDIEASVKELFDIVIQKSNRKKTFNKFFCCGGASTSTTSAATPVPRLA